MELYTAIYVSCGGYGVMCGVIVQFNCRECRATVVGNYCDGGHYGDDGDYVDGGDDDERGFQIGAGLYAVGRPVQGTKRTAKSAPINPCPSREGPYSTVFSVSRPMDPLMWLAGLLALSGMLRRIPDRQPRLGLATCVRQK